MNHSQNNKQPAATISQQRGIRIVPDGFIRPDHSIRRKGTKVEFTSSVASVYAMHGRPATVLVPITYDDSRGKTRETTLHFTPAQAKKFALNILNAADRIIDREGGAV